MNVYFISSHPIIKTLLITLLLTLLNGCNQTNDAQSYYENAVKYNNEGDVKSAFIELKNALQQDNDHIESRTLLGQIYMNLGLGKYASISFARARKQAPEDKNLIALQLRALLVEGRTDDAIEKMRTIGGKLPDIENQLITALINQAQGKTETARSIYNSILEQQPDNTEALRESGRLSIRSGNLEEAQSFIQRAIDSNERDFKAWIMKGQLDLNKKDQEAAEQDFIQALAIVNEHPGANMGLAKAMLSLGKLKKAKEHLKIAGKYQPDSPLLLYLWGYAQAADEKYQEAEKSLFFVLKQQPNHVRTLALLGKISYQQEKYEQARVILDRLLPKARSHAGSVKLLGLVYLKLEEPEETVKLMLPYMQFDVKDPQFLAILASAYISLKQYDEATAYLEKAATIVPDEAELQTALADLHIKLDDNEDAINALKSALKIDPQFIQADFMLTMLHIKSGEFEKARETAEQLVKKHPDNPISYNILASAYEMNGDTDNAKKYYQQAIEVDNDYSKSVFNLAHIDEKQGDIENAKKRYSDVINNPGASPGDISTAALLLGRQYAKEEKADTAYDIYLKALEKNPTDPRLLLEIADVLKNKKKLEDAQNFLLRATRSNPSNAPTHIALAKLMMLMGNPHSAYEAINQASKLLPSDIDVLLLKGQIQKATGDLEAAIESFTKVIEKEPDNTTAYLALSQTESRANRKGKATNALQKLLEKSRQNIVKAMKLNKGNKSLQLYALGRIDLGKGQIKSSQAIADQLKTEFQNSSLGFSLDGDVNIILGNNKLALKRYRKALEIEKTLFNVKRLNATLWGLEKRDEAIGLLNNWQETDPDNSEVKKLLSDAYYAMGDLDASRTLLEQVLLDNPNDIKVLNNLAWIYQQSHDPRALELSKKAFDLDSQSKDNVDTYGWILFQQGAIQQSVSILRNAYNIDSTDPTIRYHLARAEEKSGNTNIALKLLKPVIEGKRDFNEKERAIKLYKRLSKL